MPGLRLRVGYDRSAAPPLPLFRVREDVHGGRRLAGIRPCRSEWFGAPRVRDDGACFCDGDCGMTDARPYPKSQQLARGERRYRRKVASPKQWQAIIAAKAEQCRICGETNRAEWIHCHHLVSRSNGGDDVADNIVGLCQKCHREIHARSMLSANLLLANLSDAEYAYMIERGGEDYPERAYGIRYER